MTPNDSIYDLGVDDGECEWTFARSGGPGGQNVNKVSSKVILHWDIEQNNVLAEAVKQRIRHACKNQLTTEGKLVLMSQQHRDQERNRQDCLDKLVAIIRRALVPPKIRKPTKPSRAARENRLKDKKKRSDLKRSRRLDD